MSSTKTASINKLKRHKSSRSHNQPESIEISSDEDISVETKVKNCIASRTRSKAHHKSPSPSKKPKLTSPLSSVSPTAENNVTTLGSNIRKTSYRHHHTESANTGTSHVTNSVNNNVSSYSNYLC